MSKTKYELEYTLNTSPKVLFERLSTPSGLAEWFADDVNMVDSIYTFEWEGSEQKAELLQKKELRFARFRWLDDDDEEYFEFRIRQDELTGDVALLIVDFAMEDEKSDAVDLWDSQISELKHAIGL
ncbi:MAG: SRPBCC domain-containing protein [Bacteroidales bacterium]|nr:SRPBCC domain-containing protein [Bacteroidales bacterium]